MVIKKSLGEKVFDCANVGFMIVLMMTMLYPLIHVFAASFSNSDQLMLHKGMLFWPVGFNTGAYKMVFNNANILNGYKVTIFIVVVGTAINIFMTSLGAYVLSRRDLYIRSFLMKFVVFTMFFSGGIIPFYLVVNNMLKLGNNLMALILPVAISTWNLIIMRTYFMGIPASVEESAKIDGANDFTVLFRIILPLSMPVVAVLILFYGVGHWNAWFHSVIFIRERNLYPLQLILREILIMNSSDSMMISTGNADKEALAESIKYATIVIATVPILFVYPFLQKYFVQGIMVGAVKG